MKITVTRDITDSGERNIVEEINLKKYADFEAFTLSQVVQALRDNLNDDIVLRVHLINNIIYRNQGDHFSDNEDLMDENQ